MSAPSATGPVKFASIAAASSGDNLIVAAVTGRKIRVLALDGTAAGAVSVKWRSGTTDLCGAQALAANSQKTLPYNPEGWFETAIGAAFNLNLSGAVAFGGSVTYQEVA